MTLIVNDKPYTTEQTGIAAFLEERGFTPRLIVVELNGEILQRAHWDDVILKDGDTLQMAHMVAGG